MPANTIPQSQMEASVPAITQQALQWEKDQWTSGSVFEDSFYTAPSNSSNAAPGTLLKVEQTTNTSCYALPPATALSRIIYQSQTLNGTLVPVSAYILWPFSPRASSDGYQVVAWSHGTSGIGPDTAPSHQINLWQHYLGPFNLALQGYVVVATDYAGLGVSKTDSGEPIVHEYLTSPSQANDVFYSVQAAREAFPELGKQFVVIGHSQGGGSAWAAAQRQAIKPADGYLGAVAVSPVTSVLKEEEPIRSFLGFGMLSAITAYFPEFNLSDVLTTEGLERHTLVKQLDATATTSLTVISDVALFQSNWTQNPYIQRYQTLVLNGGKAIAKPLLVIHGEADPNLNITVTAAAVEETVQKFPDAPLEFIRVPGVTHNAALTSSQRVWMDWISDRFAGKATCSTGGEMETKAARPLDAYQPELNWYLSLATAFYQTP
ncbi:prolyl aminopeptidase-like protein [Lindgomyces ingoldianus]|uniref:Prolyl aminopeptidase-like protein n=1 Tax=Lindgomyces ingoldianus TaxID=673940 RepID=A0ACB6QCV3_9PLEO|nr:prolyl aminopeptidase-like protein [Lindgomyces ingoldianus]KAF2464809.1 prolyl aminopeptidase-like protein [Lindgomyces ingoldianus]